MKNKIPEHIQYIYSQTLKKQNPLNKMVYDAKVYFVNPYNAITMPRSRAIFEATSLITQYINSGKINEK